MIKPLRNMLLTKREANSTTSAGGIELVASAQERSQKATVIAVGPNVEGIAVGDVVFIQRYGGTEIKVDGEDYLLVDQDDLLGVFN